MARESAGSVYVSIDVDASTLLAKYAQAEAQSRAAGQKIASGLGAGLQSASGIVDQFGRSVSSGITVPMEAAAPAVKQTTAAIVGMGVAAHGSVSEIQAMSGALRTLDGNGGIRAAERFLATTLGLGGAVQAIFPIIGLVAVAEMLDKVVSKFSKAHAQTEEFTAALKSTDEAARGLVRTLDDINVDKMRDAFGGAAGERMKSTVLEMQSLDKLTEAAGLRALIKSAGENENWVTTLFGKPTDIAAVRQQITQLSLEAQSLAAQSDEARRHANEVTGPKEAAESARKSASDQRTAFKDGWDNMLADQKAAHEVSKQEELTFRQNELAAARAAGPALSPVATEVNRQVGTLSQEVRKEDADGSHALAMAQVEYASRLRREAIAELEADGRLMTAAVEKITKEMDAAKHGDAEAAAVGDRAARQASSSATGISNANQRVKALELERDYSQQVVHSRQQQIQYAQQLAAIEQETANNNILNAQADVAIAQGLNAMTPSAQTLLALQQAQTKEAEAEAAAKEVTLRSQIKIQQLGARFQLGRQIAQIGERIPGQLGGAIAGGVTGGNLGKQVADAIKGIGKDLLGASLTAAIQKLIVVSGVQALAEKAFSAIFGTTQITNTAATTANTVATVAQTTAFITGTAADVAAMAALAAAITANTTAVLLTGFIPGFASGGRPAPGVPYIVGENGPEVRIDDGPGVILPNVPSMSMLGSIQHSQSVTASSSSHAVSFGGGIHLHGISSPEAFARALPRVLKARAPNFSPATR